MATSTTSDSVELSERVKIQTVKHKIVLFSKLQSYNVAEEKVQHLLEEAVLDDNYMRECVIEKYSEKPVYSDTLLFTTVTAVVVIDARQSRTLVTPQRRDKNVDHWDELDMLNCSITKPNGSLFIVIYGDEQSKTLDRNKTFADYWSREWRFEDENASQLAQTGRVFTIWEKFNKLQKDTILHFLRVQPLLPNLDGHVSTLVFGDTSSLSVLNPYLKSHPLLMNQKSRKHGRLIEALYDYPHFKKNLDVTFTKLSSSSSSSTTKCSIRVWYSDIGSIQVCGEECENDYKSNFHISANNLRLHEIEDKLEICCLSFRNFFSRKLPEFNNIILVCHCEKCYVEVNKNLEWTTDHLKTELETVGVVVTGDIVPIVQEEHWRCIEVIDKARETITSLAKREDGALSGYKEDKLEREKPESVLKLLAWYACQTSSRLQVRSFLPFSQSLAFKLFIPKYLESAWDSTKELWYRYVWREVRRRSRGPLHQPLLDDSSIIEI
ncbi:uncharacterized protein LOC144444589 [Glandiceps talaboti]